MKANPWWVHPALLVTCIIYGANFSIAKSIMPEPIPPFGFIFIRVAVATTFFWLIHLLFVKEQIQVKREYFRLMVCGFFGAAINMLMFFKGLSLTSPVNASLIMTTTPVVVVVASYFILKERITWFKGIGLAMGFGGAVFLIGLHKFSWSNNYLLGDLMNMGNAITYAIFLVLVRPLMIKYHPITVIKWVFLFGFMFIIPFTVYEAAEISFSAFTAFQWGSLLYVVLGATVFAFLANVSALKYVSSSVVAYYTFMQPVVATVIELVAGRETPTIGKLFSALLIFGGVYLVSQRKA